ncbi:hypothetical protein F5Y03DRAFT_327251 [Xylaria venustula]|nr:hypothetical protein F5Y03DRAFT_327251 [Xylaria venustula]
MPYNNHEPYDGQDGQPPTPADNGDDHGAGSPFWDHLPTCIPVQQNVSSFTLPITSSGWPIPHPGYHSSQSNSPTQTTFRSLDLGSTRSINAPPIHPIQQFLPMSPGSSDLEFQFPPTGVLTPSSSDLDFQFPSPSGSLPAVSLPESVTSPSVATTVTPPPEKPKRKRVNRYKNATAEVLKRRRDQNRCSQRAYRERKDQRIKELEVRVGEQDEKIRQLELRVVEERNARREVEQAAGILCYPNNAPVHSQCPWVVDNYII